MQGKRIVLISPSGYKYGVILLNCSICGKEIRRKPSYKGTHTEPRCKSCIDRIIKADIPVEGDTKVCNVCSQTLKISKFSKSSKKVNCLSTCMKCYHMKKFGLTALDYQNLLEKQDYKCAICGTSERSKNYRTAGKTRDLPLDHCHETGKIRGILCNNCNVGLGAFKDNLNFLQKAIDYLEGS